MKALLVLAALIAIAIPLAAHHSFTAEYDLARPTYMDGKVTMIQWMNPHASVFMDVMDGSNRKVSWQIELSPIHSLMENGWNKSSLKIDMDICVEGFPAKSGEHKFGNTSVTIKSNGEVLKTPPGMWAQDAMNQIAAARGTPVNTPPVDIQYTGKTSCSKRN